MKCCADEAGAGRPHVDQPEAADLHHVAAATVDAEDIKCCSALSNEKKKLTIKGCVCSSKDWFLQFILCSAGGSTTDFRQNRCTGLWVCTLRVKCTYCKSLWKKALAK